MLMNDTKNIFVGQRYDTPNAWQMPQGGIDPGESPRDALFRELYEETGLSKDDVDLLVESTEWFSYDFPQALSVRLWNGKFIGQTQQWFLLKLKHADMQKITLNTHTPEFTAWQWVDRAQLVDLIVDFKKDMYQKVIDHFAHYL
jgi:putative (di)nucleoside polyphosphate hydrolase